MLFVFSFLFVARENCAYASWLNTITAVARRRFGIEVNTFKTSGYPIFVINVILSIIAVCAGISEVRAGRLRVTYNDNAAMDLAKTWRRLFLFFD